jgi:threonine/homoserine/homoserine lactone efflux protein
LRGLPLALFQLANPKAWVLVLFVAASARAARLSEWIAPILVLTISLTCSLVWGGLGQALSRFLTHPRYGVTVRRALAGAMFAAAIDLSLPQIGAIL